MAGPTWNAASQRIFRPSRARLALRVPRGSSAVLALVCVAQFMVILDVSIVNVALPSIRFGSGVLVPPGCSGW